MNSKDIIISVCFLLAALMCVYEMIHGTFTPYYLTGMFLFTFVSWLFFKKSKTRK